jgi:hypothetical protein
MKDGYYQMKIAELDDRLKKLKDKSIVLDLQQQSIERKIESYDVLLKKLNNIEKFREKTYQSLFENNKKLLDDFSQEILSKLSSVVDEQFDCRMEDIDGYLSQLKDKEKSINECRENLYNLSVWIDKAHWFGAALSEHLVKKNIMTDQDRRELYDIAERSRQKEIRNWKKNNKKRSITNHDYKNKGGEIWIEKKKIV